MSVPIYLPMRIFYYPCHGVHAIPNVLAIIILYGLKEPERLLRFNIANVNRPATVNGTGE